MSSISLSIDARGWREMAERLARKTLYAARFIMRPPKRTIVRTRSRNGSRYQPGTTGTRSASVTIEQAAQRPERKTGAPTSKPQRRHRARGIGSP